MTRDELIEELVEAASAIVHSDEPVMFLVGEEGADIDEVNDYWNRFVEALAAVVKQ